MRKEGPEGMQLVYILACDNERFTQVRPASTNFVIQVEKAYASLSSKKSVNQAFESSLVGVEVFKGQQNSNLPKVTLSLCSKG